jgi:hypothetical protein
LRNEFGRVLCGLAAVTALTTAITMAGLGSASAVAMRPAARAATAVCGHNCVLLSSLLLGPDTIASADVPGDTGTGGKIGQLVTLQPASNSSPDEDFTDYAISQNRPQMVGEFCAAWPAPQSFNPRSYVCRNYSGLPVYELSWSPYGNESGLCAGLARAGVTGENVTIRTCGRTARTPWIPDANHCTGNGNYWPVISGSDASFSHPLVLTVDAASSHPAGQLRVQRENLLPGGVAPGNQAFTAVLAPRPVQARRARLAGGAGWWAGGVRPQDIEDGKHATRAAGGSGGRSLELASLGLPRTFLMSPALTSCTGCAAYTAPPHSPEL